MKSTTYLLMLFCVFLSPTMSIGQNCTGNDVPPAPYVGDLHAFCGCQSATAKAQHRDAFYQALPNKIFEWYDNPNHTGVPLTSTMDGNISLFNTDKSQTVYVFEVDNGCYSPPSQVEMTAFSLPTSLPLVYQGNTELPNFTTLRSCESVVLTATPSKPNGVLTWYATSSRSQLLATGPTYTITSGQSVFVFEEPEAQNCTGTGDVLMCYGAPTQINIIILPKPTVNVGADQVLCKAGDSKTLTATVSDGSPPFEYLWSNGATTPSITVSTPQNYAVIVTNADFFRCSATDDVDVSLSTLVVLLGADKTVCPNATTTITPSISGGKAPFTYAWKNGQSTPSVTVGAGTYQVSVTDDNGCLSSDEVVVTTSNSLIANAGADKTVCSGLTTDLTATATGGVAPFTFHWSNGQNTPSVNVGIGTYQVTAMDANGCSANDEVIVKGGNSLTVNIQQVNNRCKGANDGGIFITPLSGTQPFSYSIDNGISWSQNANFYRLVAGNYPVVVREAGGCTYSQTVTITETTAITFAETVNSGCNGGSIKFENAIGGNGIPYQYSINYGQSWQSSNTFSNLPSGSYYLKVRDAFGCNSALKTISINPPQAIKMTVNTTKGSCGNGGTITVEGVTGGLAPYQYSQNGGNSWQANATFTNVQAGIYTIRVRDANLCVSNSQSVQITQTTLSVNVQQSNNRCYGGTDGGIFLTCSSGAAPYAFSIDNGVNWLSTSNFYNLSAGTYIVKVKDNTGCVFSKNITITQGPAINFSAKVTETSCIGSDDGKITFNQPTGGSGPGNSNNYKYSINYGNNLRGNGNFKNLEAGMYHLRVQDGIGCFSDIQPIKVSQPAPITFTTTVQNITCGYTSNGIIGVASVSGGTPQYKYSKNGGDKYQSTNSFLFLTAGTYPMRIKDNNGCESPIQNVVIKQNCGTQYSVRQAKPVQKIPVVIYSIAPNPSDDFIRIELNSLNAHEQEFLFFDALGKAILTQKRLLEAGVQRVEFDVSGLPQGVYQIITNGSYARNVPNRFVKI